MIAAKEIDPTLTPEEYFVWEEKQLEKHEYIDGQVYAMSGGSVNHGRIAIRFTAMFDAHLEGSGCMTGNSDIKVNLVETNNYTYPDASVTCDDRDKSTPNYFTYPCLIVEVLSDSTEAYDSASRSLSALAAHPEGRAPQRVRRGEQAERRAGGKFRMYSQNPVLQDYLLVSATRIEMDLDHKNDAGEWTIVNYQEGDIIELKSINLSFPIEQVYRGLILTPES